MNVSFPRVLHSESPSVVTHGHALARSLLACSRSTHQHQSDSLCPPISSFPVTLISAHSVPYHFMTCQSHHYSYKCLVSSVPHLFYYCGHKWHCLYFCPFFLFVPLCHCKSFVYTVCSGITANYGTIKAYPTK